jgi:hypothetical protein
MNQFDVASILRRQTARPSQNTGKADDGVERRAQLVGHVGQEVRLGRDGALGLIQRRLQLKLKGLALGDVA